MACLEVFEIHENIDWKLKVWKQLEGQNFKILKTWRVNFLKNSTTVPTMTQKNYSTAETNSMIFFQFILLSFPRCKFFHTHKNENIIVCILIQINEQVCMYLWTVMVRIVIEYTVKNFDSHFINKN